MDLFKSLHYHKNPLHLGNVWDLQSALLYQKLGFKAIGTSSAAVAASLGYEDGEKLPFEKLVALVKEIKPKINIPLTVDIEGGYSRDASKIAENIKTLHQIGVVGVNLEDSITNAEREILDAKDFSFIIQKIKSFLSKESINVFLNVRTDPYLMGLENPLNKTLERIKLYEEAGADGIFVPCVVQEEEIAKITQSVSLPVNVMCMPDLPSFETLEKLGVKRISEGNFVYNKIAADLEKTVSLIIENKSFGTLFK